MTNNGAQHTAGIELAAELTADGYTDVTRLLTGVPEVITSVWSKVDDDGDTVAKVLIMDVVIGNLVILADGVIYAETWFMSIYGGASKSDTWSVADALEWITETCDLDI